MRKTYNIWTLAPNELLRQSDLMLLYAIRPDFDKAIADTHYKKFRGSSIMFECKGGQTVGLKRLFATDSKILGE